MIFATVGSQMPFDRLIQALDDWVSTQAPETIVLAQVGATGTKPHHFKAVESLSPSAFRDAMRSAKLIVAHAGMGSVLTAMEFGKPLVVLPRLGERQETRNDHQVATAKWLSKKPGIFVAMDESELAEAINRASAHTQSATEIAPVASPELIEALKTFIRS